MGRILVGTASWTDASLIKSKLFYPPEARSPEERLRYYASQFPIVEVDSSYYAMPSAANAENWAGNMEVHRAKIVEGMLRNCYTEALAIRC